METRIASPRKGASRSQRPSGKLPVNHDATERKNTGTKVAKTKAPSVTDPPETALAFSHDQATDCQALGAQVAGVIRSFHSQVASPLASIGLQLELLRMNPATGEEAREELARINQRLDVLIDVIRAANRSLREVEKTIRHEAQTVPPSR